jgi:hypothetical protein
MNSNWNNFLKNTGEWEGSFTEVFQTGELGNSTPSILSLEASENDTLVKFRLRRYSSRDYTTEPISDNSQEYRTIGRQNVFFDTGAFSKGTIQVSPFTEFGAEYGFVAADRRLRFVQLFDLDRHLQKLVLIREFRRGSQATERPFLTVEQLLGKWVGEAVTVYADWRDPEVCPTSLEIRSTGDDSRQHDRLQQELSFGGRTIVSTATIQGNILQFDTNDNPRQITLLPDGGSSNVPLEIPLQKPFFVEVGWLVNGSERQRLMRSYSDRGEWISATHTIEYKV